MGELEVVAHPLDVDRHLTGHPRGKVLHVVEQDGGVGKDDPLGTGVGDVALVPQRDVLVPRLRVSAQDAGQPGQPLGEDRVALVRHRGGALLAGSERLFDLADLGALEVADLGCESLQAGARQGDRAEQLGVAITRHHLG